MHYESNVAGYEDGLEDGKDKERARLRPLLERCLDMVTGWTPHGAAEVAADLRSELGLKGEE